MTTNTNSSVDSVSDLATKAQQEAQAMFTVAWATRADEARAAALAAGFSNEAAEELVRLGAPDRHRRRVDAATDAMTEAATAAASADHGWSQFNAAGRAALAFLVGLVAHLGYGGRAGRGGAGSASDRLAPLTGLGKGRRQAADGAAWDAAIEEALRRLLDESRARYISTYMNCDLKVVVEVYEQDGEVLAWLMVENSQALPITSLVLAMAGGFRSDRRADRLTFLDQRLLARPGWASEVSLAWQYADHDTAETMRAAKESATEE